VPEENSTPDNGSAAPAHTTTPRVETVATVTSAPAESARETTIRVHDLNHYYGSGDLRKQVLFDNRLEVRAGEIIIMTGPSGSGKTTLLTLTGTLRTVQEGSLQVLGKELLGATNDELVATRRDIGFIFQAHNLFASLTAFQNVRMGMELFGYSAREMKTQAETLLTRLELGDHIHKKPSKLSGGQKQRVAIARGVAHSPRIILADEPTAALDGKTGRIAVNLFKELAEEQGCTILMVTHDNRILDVADRIVKMEDGYIKSNVNVAVSREICEFLQRESAFSGFNPSKLSAIADSMWMEKHEAGAEVIKQGDAGDTFYLIREGAVEVIDESSGSEEIKARLGAGAYFGEAALLTNKPRNATIRTTQPTRFYVMNKESFLEAKDHSPSLDEELRNALFSR